MEAVSDRRIRRFDSSSAAPRVGRGFVDDALADWGVLGKYHDAAIVTSELVTNGIRHAEGSVTLAVALSRDRVRIEVSDCSARRPTLGTLEPDQVGGWGMQIVERLAVEWGTEIRVGGKTVWCELSRGDYPTQSSTDG